MTITGKKIRRRKYVNLFSGFLAGILGGILTWLVTDFIAVKHERIAQSAFVVDRSDVRQGEGSLRWDFVLQPERKYLFSRTISIGGFLHFEVRGDFTGHVKGLDLRGFRGIKFYAKSSSETFHITEVNLFTGPKYLQYVLLRIDGLVINTKWNEYFLDFSDFSLAPWERKYRLNLVPDMTQPDIPDLRNVTAFGFDLKTSEKKVIGKLWIDYIRLVDDSGNKKLLSDADNKKFIFNGRQLVWMSDWREYP